MAFITFNEIVEQATVSIWDSQNEQRPLVEKTINNSNFENIDFNFGKGVYRFDIIINGKLITKTIRNN